MKLKKKSGLMGAIIALSCASLVSVGFASWVISQKGEASVDGQIIVESISDQRHVISATLQSPSTGQIKYVAKSGSAQDSTHWLYSDGSAGVETLTAVYDVTITNVPSTFAYTDFDVEFVAGQTSPSFTPDTTTLNSESGYAKAQSLNLVAALPVVAANAEGAGGSIVFADAATAYTANSGANQDTSLGTRAFVVTITFKWGSAFNGQNPYDYYAGKDIATYGDQAAQNLTNLETYLSGEGYKLTISYED